jgi:hypothetical protein
MNMNSQPDFSKTPADLRGNSNPGPALDHRAADPKSFADSGDPRAARSRNQQTGAEHEDGSLPASARGKLDAAAKDLICKLVARGHSLAAAARLVGVSERAIYKCKRRDPLFKLQLGKHKERIASSCLRAMRKAVVVDDDWRAGTQLMRLTYPERYYARPNMISTKKHEKAMGELIKPFASIATPQQMMQLERRLGPDGDPRN